MNLYAFVAFVLLGLCFLGIGLDWLGWAFLVLGFLALTFKSQKSLLRKSWDEAAAAEGSYPEGKLAAYTSSASKQFAELTSTYEKTRYNMGEVPHKFSDASKNALNEVNELFK